MLAFFKEFAFYKFIYLFIEYLIDYEILPCI